MPTALAILSVIGAILAFIGLSVFIFLQYITF
jgi:hypothetical protein